MQILEVVQQVLVVCSGLHDTVALARAGLYLGRWLVVRVAIWLQRRRARTNVQRDE